MHCYRHAPAEALGICRSCGRGVCAQCVREVGLSLACSLECEERVRRGDALIANSEASFRQARRGSVVLVIFPILLGAVLCYFGLNERGWFNALTAMGSILILFGIVAGWRQRRMQRQLQ